MTSSNAPSTRAYRTGRGLVVGVAVGSIVIPVVVDGIVFGPAHMQNPAWLPHAKLHCAMSFHDAIGLGIGALAVLGLRWRRLGRGDAVLAGFLAATPWLALLLARVWPGTSWSFAGDPVYGSMSGIHVGGVVLDPNMLLSVLLVALAGVGSGLLVHARPADATAPSLHGADVGVRPTRV